MTSTWQKNMRLVRARLHVNEVFADTSGWLSALTRTERFHSEAAALIRQWESGRIRVVTTNYVLAELVALMAQRVRSSREQQLRAIDTLKSSPNIVVIHIDEDIDAAAWDLLKARPDKSWSLVDCASFVLMERRRISQALTLDVHFEQAGFVRLLK